jgi:hypothetical protein
MGTSERVGKNAPLERGVGTTPGAAGTVPDSRTLAAPCTRSSGCVLGLKTKSFLKICISEDEITGYEQVMYNFNGKRCIILNNKFLNISKKRAFFLK